MLRGSGDCDLLKDVYELRELILPLNVIYREKILYKPLRVVGFQYDLEQTVSDLWDLRSNHELGSQTAPSVGLFWEEHDGLLFVNGSFRLS